MSNTHTPDADAVQQAVGVARDAWDPLALPPATTQLVADLRDAGAPDRLIRRAGFGVYHDYVSPASAPKHLLVQDAREAGVDVVAVKARQGDYDDSLQEALPDADG